MQFRYTRQKFKNIGFKLRDTKLKKIRSDNQKSLIEISNYISCQKNDPFVKSWLSYSTDGTNFYKNVLQLILERK